VYHKCVCGPYLKACRNACEYHIMMMKFFDDFVVLQVINEQFNPEPNITAFAIQIVCNLTKYQFA